MEFKYVMEFVKLVESGKFSDAADDLYVSQSSLSKHMKVLEEELGVPLFERETKRRVQLTQFGKLFQPYAEQMSILYQEYLSMQRKQQKETTATLKIGSIPAMAQYGITNLLARFRTAHPETVFSIEENESALSIERVLSGDLDFAFVRETVGLDDAKLHHMRYATDSLCAVMPASHPKASAPYVTLQDLKDENFLLLKNKSFMYEMCMEECLKAGFSPNIVYTGSQGDNIVNMVGCGSGVALLTRQPISNLKNPNVRAVDIVPPIQTEINLVFNRQLQLTRDAQLFLEFFRESMAK